MRQLIVPSLAVLAFAVGSPADARMRVVDGGPVTYLLSGNGWHYNEVDLRNNRRCPTSGACAIPIGFTINYGAGSVSSLYLSENGIVTFGAPKVTMPAGDGGATALSSFTTPYIAPFYTNFVSTYGVDDGLGEISWGPGRIDAAEDPSLLNDTSLKTWQQGAKAFKVDWTGVTRGAEARFYVQIAIYDLAGDDFDLEFNYGLIEPTAYARSGAQVGFKLGSNYYQFTSANIVNTSDMVFRFRNGVWVA